MSHNLQQKNKNSAFWLLGILVLGIAVISLWMKYSDRELFTVMKAPEFRLMSHRGKEISSEDMKGKVYLVEFFFSTCPTICPVMNSNMKAIDSQITSKDFGIISISIDPKNDTQEQLKKHAELLGITNPNWHLLTGDSKYIRELAQKFNIYVGKEDSGTKSLDHSGMIALVDKNGNVRSRYDAHGVPVLYYSGLNYEDPEGKRPSLTGKHHPDREKLIADIQTLLNK